MERKDIGSVVDGECSGCGEISKLRFDGVQVSPKRKILLDLYTCMSCGTTRVYGVRACGDVA